MATPAGHNGRVGRDDRSEAELQVFADLLQQRIMQAQAQRGTLTRAITDMRTARSLTFADDEHDPEGPTVSLDQARDQALLVRTETTLAELVAALDRLLGGSYGVCERCGRDIATDRLAARPEARRCMACSVSGSRRPDSRR
jgi:RNA polymerase-binding transcription factor DksA